MNYLIRKPKHDARLFTCGFKMPDGFYIVTPMTFDNKQQLENIRQFGYIVETTDLQEGTYTPAGLRVDPVSVWDHYVEKRGPLRYIDEMPADGADVVVAMPEVRPPDVNLRPPTPSIDDIPPVTARSVEMTSEAATVAPSAESEIVMLRTALTARGIDWHPRNNAATLKAKLEESDATA